MQPLRSYTGRAVPLPRSDVDTDQICPAEYCKRITKSGFDDALFARWRAEPGFVLDRPERRGAGILLAGPDFGTGSSREHAVWALRDWGFVAVLAPRFGDIFRRNALKNGLLAAALPQQAVDRLTAASQADSQFLIEIDVETRTVSADGTSWAFDLDERTRWLLLNGYDDIELTLRNHDRISAYERSRPHWLPALHRTGTGRPERITVESLR